MTESVPHQPCERVIPELGPIVLWPLGGEEERGLLLEVSVCPFPGCPERHVLVDGFLLADGDPGERDPDWAFRVSVDVDPPGEVRVEGCRDPVALGWLPGELDGELRAARLARFDRLRAELDAPLGARDPARITRRTAGAGWTSEAIPPDRLAAVLAGFERAARGRAGRRGAVAGPRIGRNDPCPCGSGKKYKRCCLGSA